MHRTMWRTASLVMIMALALLGRVEAQQHQQHHRGGTQGTQERTDAATQDTPAPQPMGQQMQGMMQHMQGMMQQMQGMMQQMHGRMGGRGMRDRGMMREQDDDDLSDDGQGMMGRGMMGRGMMGHMQHQLERFTQQLELSDEQQAKVEALMRTHTKDVIRLQADIDTASIDLHQLLDTQPVDMARVKAALQTISGKEADLDLAHIAIMQDIRALLTPEQQQQFRTMWGHMMGRDGKMGRGHKQRHGKTMGRGDMQGQGAMQNPCGMSPGKSSQ